LSSYCFKSLQKCSFSISTSESSGGIVRIGGSLPQLQIYLMVDGAWELAFLSWCGTRFLIMLPTAYYK
jgi:hypothetical protein